MRGTRARAWLRGPARRALRDRLRDVRLTPRRAVPPSWRLRPSFLLVGGRKCGTTSLFDWLGQHPDVVPPLWKEPRYFDRHPERGLGWYLAHFPLRRRDGALTGEATTGYLAHPHAAARIAAALPEARIVAVLRNPIERAISDYEHERRRGGELRSMAEAFEAELEALGGREPEHRRDPTAERARYAEARYLGPGLYVPQLERYLAHFDRRRIRVLRFEDLFGDPAHHFPELLRFLGLRPDAPVRFRALNVGAGRSAPIDRDRLRAFFRPHNEALAELLGLELDDWR